LGWSEIFLCLKKIHTAATEITHKINGLKESRPEDEIPTTLALSAKALKPQLLRLYLCGVVGGSPPWAKMRQNSVCPSTED
jgi:hypothetical protein